MPLYRHECESCGHRFRVLVLQDGNGELPICPQCGSPSTRRLLPLVAVQFKGSGFYKTDHGRKGRSRPERGGGESGASSASDPAEEKRPSSPAKAAASSD